MNAGAPPMGFMVRSQSLNSPLIGNLQAKLNECCVVRGESDPVGERIRRHRRRHSGEQVEECDEMSYRSRKLFFRYPHVALPDAVCCRTTTRNMVIVGHRDFLDINVPEFFLKF